MAIVQNLLQISMPKLVYSLYLTLDNIKNVFFNFHNFDFTTPLMPRKQDGGKKFLKLYRRSKYFWQTLYFTIFSKAIIEAAFLTTAGMLFRVLTP